MSILIDGLKLGEPDPRGNTVQEIYALVSATYAVYLANDRVSVFYADDPDMALRQRDNFAGLETLRGEILALMEGWTGDDAPDNWRTRAASYNRRLADGLILAFREQVEAAKATLEAVKADLLRERKALGRRQYVYAALGASGLVLILGASLLSAAGAKAPAAAEPLFQAAVSGCFGALFSIALSMHSRTMQPDTLRGENIMDACLRIAIGAMSAVIIHALLQGHMLKLEIAGAVLGAEDGFGYGSFIASVLAGFSERLAGDILGTGARAAEAPATPPPIVPNAGRSAALALAAPLALAGGMAPLGLTRGLGPAGAPLPEEDDPETHVDGCACDVTDAKDTEDLELPPARGGVEA